MADRVPLDRDLADLPREMRWREWMGRVEAVCFASPEPVPREVIASLVGRDCVLDDLIADIRDELKTRPYDLVAVAGGYHHRTRPRFADVIHASATRARAPSADLTPSEGLVLAAIAHLQPVDRARLVDVLARPVSRDILARLQRIGLVANGPRLAQPGAPTTYVTTPTFLSVFGMKSLADLPELEAWPVGEANGVARVPGSPFDEDDANEIEADAED